MYAVVIGEPDPMCSRHLHHAEKVERFGERLAGQSLQLGELDRKRPFVEPDHISNLAELRFSLLCRIRIELENTPGDGVDEPHVRFITTSARGIHCSDDGCLISTSLPVTTRCGSSLCCTMPGPCCSTSVSPGASICRYGQIAFSWSMPNTLGCGSFQHSDPSPPPPPCWFGPTDMW